METDTLTRKKNMLENDIQIFKKKNDLMKSMFEWL